MGQFIFPKSILLEKKILSSNGIGGKRAIRVYSPWDIPVNIQAKKAQEWQLKYFLDMSQDKSIDCIRARTLYSNKRITP